MDGKEPVSAPGAVPGWNALPSSVLCRRELLGISAAPSPWAPCRSLSSRWGFWGSPFNLGVFPCSASPPEDRPFRGWSAAVPAPHSLLERMFCLFLLLASFSEVSPVFSHLSMPAGVPFLLSEQSSELCALPTEQRISLATGASVKYREEAETL